MKTSGSIKEIAAALAKAQGAMGGARKDSMNPHFRSKYADLTAIIEALQEPLAANELSYTQELVTNDKDECGVEMMLMHSSGEWIHYGPYFLPVSKRDAQGFGSAATYACRYQLRAVFCLPTLDDDGNLAAAAKPDGESKRTTLDPKAEADLLASLDEATDADDLRERTKRALAVAHEGGDVEAFKRIKAHAVAISERVKATVQ